MTAPTWDWQQAARRAGATADGSFNAGTMRLPSPRAVIWQQADGVSRTFSGQQMEHRAREIASVLVRLGVRRGDRVAGLLGRRPAAFATALAVWQLGAVYVPLFTGFGGEGLAVRLLDCEPSLVVTDRANRASVAAVQDRVPSLIALMVDGPGEPGDAVLSEELERAGDLPVPVATRLGDLSTIMYTSGTTGKPKGCLIPHHAVISLAPYVEFFLDLGSADVLFSGADAGWSFGLFTTGFAPMSRGVPRVIYEGPFSATGWWSAVEGLGAGHLAAAPTAFRQLAAAGADAVPAQFRAGSSAGEPLDAATVDWFRANTGVTLHDSYGLSELGMVIGNLRRGQGPAVLAGSMGVPLPGFEVQLLDLSGEPVDGEGHGRIAVRDNGFFLSTGYWGRAPEWEARFADGWFLTEDIARRDEEGRFWYEGRSDDVIVAAGYNVGPVEVESALLTHPMVVDVGCVAEPDPVKGSVVAVHVVLAQPAAAGQDLQAELRRWVGERVGWHAAPRKLYVKDELPRTASGKLQRGVLRAQPGTPVGSGP